MSASFRLWAKEDKDRRIIHVLVALITALFILCLLLGLGWHRAPKQLTVFVPPDLSSGVTMRAGEIPKTNIYSFAYLVWQELNHWPEETRAANGQSIYINNINQYRAYLTPDFRAQLLQDAEKLKKTGELNRTRQMIGHFGAAFEPDLVQKVAEGEWVVFLDVNLTERAQDWTVKDIHVRYPLRVVYRDVSRHHNPYGLMLAGFTSKPQRLMVGERKA